jgi:hypothetical protein
MLLGNLVGFDLDIFETDKASNTHSSGESHFLCCCPKNVPGLRLARIRSPIEHRLGAERTKLSNRGTGHVSKSFFLHSLRIKSNFLFARSFESNDRNSLSETVRKDSKTLPGILGREE